MHITVQNDKVKPSILGPCDEYSEFNHGRNVSVLRDEIK